MTYTMALHSQPDSMTHSLTLQFPKGDSLTSYYSLQLTSEPELEPIYSLMTRGATEIAWIDSGHQFTVAGGINRIYFRYSNGHTPYSIGRAEFNAMLELFAKSIAIENSIPVGKMTTLDLDAFGSVTFTFGKA